MHVKETYTSEHPTDPFANLGPQDLEIGECYVVKERRGATDFEAQML